MVRINLIPVRQGKKRELGRQQLVAFGFVLALGVAANYLWTTHVEEEVNACRSRP